MLKVTRVELAVGGRTGVIVSAGTEPMIVTFFSATNDFKPGDEVYVAVDSAMRTEDDL